ncbi:MAG: TetR/AcrR family transcriptional regulator [Acidimicrobiia bacterium]
MPKLWAENVETHRNEVRNAILDASAALVDERGPLAVTMSEIAEKSGIGRATLYKYFADVEAVLIAWHERHVHGHLAELAAIARRSGTAGERLEAVLERYASIVYERHRSDVAAVLHRDEHIAHAQSQLNAFIHALVSEGARSGELRDDISPDELTTFCLHALAGAGTLTSKAAVGRLVTVTLAGLRQQ